MHIFHSAAQQPFSAPCAATVPQQNCMLFGPNFPSAPLPGLWLISTQAGWQLGGIILSSAYLGAHTLTQTSRNPFLKQQMNRLVDQPAPVRWGAPGPRPSGGVGGGCFSDWGERDWLWRRRREGGSAAGWRWGTPAAATAWSRRCRGLPRGSRCTRNKGT